MDVRYIAFPSVTQSNQYWHSTFNMDTGCYAGAHYRSLSPVLEGQVMPEFSQAWLALIGAILGGSGLKFIEHYLSRPKIKEDTAAAFRKELREEMAILRAELKSSEADVDKWRDSTYALREELSQTRIARDEALHKIQDDADAALYSEHTNQEKKAIQDARDVASKLLAEEGNG